MDLRGAGRRDARAWVLIGLVTLATLVVHVVAASRMRVPIIQADEAGYLGNARYIAQGIGRTGAAYAAGYSLLLAPAAVLSHDPLTAYHLSLVVNAFLAASVPLLGFLLARRVLPEASTGALLGAALVLVLYPGWSAFANLALSENALIPAVLATAYVISVAGRSLPKWCVAAAIASYASWVSPRGILVVAAFTISCFVSTRPWRAGSRSPGVPAIVVAFVVTLLGRAVNIEVLGSTRIHGVQDSGLQPIRALLHPHLWAATLADVLGRIIYTSTATLGLAVVGAVVLTAALVGRRTAAPSESLVAVAAFAVPALFLTLFLSATSAVEIPVADVGYFIYGRYVDGVLAPVLVIGAAWSFGKVGIRIRRVEIVRAIAVGAVLAAAVLVFALIRPRTYPHASINIANVLALRVYLLHVHRSLPTVLLATIAVATLAVILVAVDRRVGAAAMIVFFSWSSWLVYEGYAVHDSIGRAKQHVLVEAIDRLHAIGVDTSCVAIDEPPNPPGWYLANYEFFVPSSNFRAVDATHPPGCGPLVLSGLASIDSRFPGARPVSYENYVALGIWVDVPRVPQPVRDALLTSGLLGPTPVTAALPDAAYRSSIRLVARRTTTHDLQVMVHVQHIGSGAPWPGSVSAVQPGHIGLVRLLVTLDDGGRVVSSSPCPVPRTMLPGDEADVLCVVRSPSSTGPALIPGAYTVRVELDQIGVTKFTAKGDRAATLAVTLRS